MQKIPLANERLFLGSPNINVCFVITLEGVCDKAKIDKAVGDISLRHPLFNSFMERDDDNNAFLVKKNECIHIEYYTHDDTDWKTWYTQSDAVPFDFLHGPLVRMCVISGEQTEIILLGHHIAGDGIGYLNAVKDFLSALDSRLDTRPYLPPYEATDRYFKETILLDPGVHAYAQSLNEEWKTSRTRFSEHDYRVFFEHYRGAFVPNLHMDALRGENIRAMAAKARSNGLTVNEMLTAAFSQAVMEVTGKHELRLGVAVNIRNELVSEPNACMGNYVSGIAAKAYCNPEHDFMTNAGTTAGMMREHLSNPKNRHLAVHFLNEFEKDLLESVPYAAYGAYDHPAAKKLAELIGEQSDNKGLGVSNLGRHACGGYHTIQVRNIQFIGPVFPANVLTVDLLTVNNLLNICLRYNEGEMSAETVQTIYDKAVEFVQ